MNNYLIHEANLERLEKKISTIKNKCNKNNISFTYNVVGYEIKEVKLESGEKCNAKFYNVEVEGKAIQNDWEFVAVLDHHANGNVIRAFNTELQIPERFNTCGPTCEHCNKIRSRKDTYIVYNSVSGEWKQVGRTCLQEFTNGLDAEDIARYISLFDEMIQGYSISGGSNFERYMPVDEVLAYSFESVRHFGYERSSYEDEYTGNKHTSTRTRVSDYYSVRSGLTRMWPKSEIERIENEMNSIGFDPERPETLSEVEGCLSWLSEADETNNSYMHNLKVIASDKYVKSRDFGILVSAPVGYFKYLERQEELKNREAEKEKELHSEFQGTEGERITFAPNYAKCITSWYNQYGVTYMYKFVDATGNVYMWYASSAIDEDREIESITGTVKKHETYKDVKQTVLTRCKVTYASKKNEEHPDGTFDIDEVFESFER